MKNTLSLTHCTKKLSSTCCHQGSLHSLDCLLLVDHGVERRCDGLSGGHIVAMLLVIDDGPGNSDVLLDGNGSRHWDSGGCHWKGTGEEGLVSLWQARARAFSESMHSVEVQSNRLEERSRMWKAHGAGWHTTRGACSGQVAVAVDVVNGGASPHWVRRQT